MQQGNQEDVPSDSHSEDEVVSLSYRHIVLI